MSTETAPATPAPAAPEARADEGATPNEPLGEPGLAALKSERDARKAAEKAAADALAKVKEYEDREKTEAQKQQEALEKAQRELAEVTIAKTRAEVAAAKGVPAELLSGSTQEELEASAERLINWRGAQPVPPEQGRFIIPAEGGQPAIPLNGDGLETALKQALGIS